MTTAVLEGDPKIASFSASPLFHAVIGAAVWAGGMFLLRPNWAAALLLLAPLVTVPMGLLLVETPDRQGRHAFSWRVARTMCLPSAVLLIGSFSYPPSRPALLLALPWLAITLLAALFGVQRLLSRGLGPPEEAAIDVGLVYLAVGGVWMVLQRGFPEGALGFSNLIALFTAAHFHYAGFGLCILTGFAGRRLPRGGPLPLVLAITLGVIVLAVAITSGKAWFEAAAGVFLALAGWVMAGVHVRLAVLPGQRAMFRVLIAVSGLCLAAALTLASLFAIRAFKMIPWVLDLANMARWHGSTNALGFTLVGLFAWSIAPAVARARPPGVPLGKLGAFFHVGADFFERKAAVTFQSSPPRGVVDTAAQLEHETFDPSRVDPAVRAVLEQTSRHDLQLRASYHRGFRLAGKLFGAFARKSAQLTLHAHEAYAWIVGLDSEKDGREGARGLIVTAEDGSAVAVASAASYARAGKGYLVLSFPVPLGILGVVLRAEGLEAGQEDLGLVLTTQTSARDDGGAWLQNGLGSLRLPMRITARFWTREMKRFEFPEAEALPGARVIVRADVWILGGRALTIECVMRHRRSSAET